MLQRRLLSICADVLAALRHEELLKQYHEKRTALDAKIDKQLAEIENMLGIKIEEA